MLRTSSFHFPTNSSRKWSTYSIPDHVTYASLCHLSVRACVRSKERGVQRVPEFAADDQSLRVLHYGECREFVDTFRIFGPAFLAEYSLRPPPLLQFFKSCCSVWLRLSDQFYKFVAIPIICSLSNMPTQRIHPSSAHLILPLPNSSIHCSCCHLHSCTVHISLTQSALCTFRFVRGAMGESLLVVNIDACEWLIWRKGRRRGKGDG